jgi:hypothetical protein
VDYLLACRDYYENNKMIDFYSQLQLLLSIPQSGDIQTFQQYANNIAHGLIPYINFYPEYPPFALFFMYLPYLVDKNPITYLLWFGVLVTLAIILGALFIWLQGRDIKKIYLFGFLLFLLQASPYQFIYQRFDIFVAILTFASVYFFFKLKNESLGWFSLFIATMTKIFPIVLFPLFFLKTKRKWLSLWFIVPMAIFNLFLIWATKGQYLTSITIQGTRSAEVQSFISTFPIGTHLFFGAKLSGFFAVSTWNLEIPKQLLRNLRFLIFGLLVIPFVISYLKKTIYSFNSTRLSAILITGFILANIVFCPQYLIWLIPFVPFLDLGEIGIFVIIVAITTSIFNLPFDSSKQNDWIYLMLFIRNVLLVVFYYKLFIEKFPKITTVLSRAFQPQS